MSKELIFIADDFGLNPAVNDAIVHAHRLGELTGAALMMAQPATEEAVALARQNPKLQVGWHLHLCDSIPATITHWPWANSPTAAGFAIGLSPRARALVRREVATQWRLFQQTGLTCRFLNSHHHLHAHPYIYQVLCDTVGHDFLGWIRLGRPHGLRTPSRLGSILDAIYLRRRRRLSHWRTPDTLWGIGCKLTTSDIAFISAALPDGFHEFLFHPRSRSCSDTLCLLQLKAALACT